MRVNRKKVKLRRGKARALKGGGKIAYNGTDVIVEWPDGSQGRVWRVGEWGVAFILHPAASRAGKLTGLLGNLDGDDTNDFVGRDGRRYDSRIATGEDSSAAAFKAFYGRFGKSWLVRQTRSLFVYLKGKRSRSYYKKRFPKRAYTVASLSPAIAVLAARHHIPFYVAAPLSTLDPDTPDGSAIPIEERSPSEVTSVLDHEVSPAGAEAANFAFDVTPAELVTAIVTEAGVLEPPYEDSIARALSATIDE